jgi:hypothetical protein
MLNYINPLRILRMTRMRRPPADRRFWVCIVFPSLLTAWPHLRQPRRCPHLVNARQVQQTTALYLPRKPIDNKMVILLPYPPADLLMAPSTQYRMGSLLSGIWTASLCGRQDHLSISFNVRDPTRFVRSDASTSPRNQMGNW